MFAYDGNPTFTTENVAPFSLAGDNYGNYNAWTPAIGSHNLSATPYSGINGGGVSGTAFSITFEASNDPQGNQAPQADAGEGQGGPHAGMDTIWPMGIILRAMTSTENHKIVWCVKQLLNTHADLGFIHETFHKDDATRYSRSWFAWANTLFGELIVKLYRDKPQLLKSI
ncbi:MAG: glycoside hydrolase family 125 protein [Calditrichia bacterium]